MHGEEQLLNEDAFIPYPQEFRDLDKIAKDYEEKFEKKKERAGYGRMTEQQREEWWRRNRGIPPSDGANSGGQEWCTNNWGSKWGFGGNVSLDEGGMNTPGEIGSLMYTFDSAWSPPQPLIAKMGEMFPLLAFALSYEEPGMNFAGTYIMEGGNVIMDEAGEMPPEEGMCPECGEKLENCVCEKKKEQEEKGKEWEKRWQRRSSLRKKSEEGLKTGDKVELLHGGACAYSYEEHPGIVRGYEHLVAGEMGEIWSTGLIEDKVNRDLIAMAWIKFPSAPGRLCHILIENIKKPEATPAQEWEKRWLRRSSLKKKATEEEADDWFNNLWEHDQVGLEWLTRKDIEAMSLEEQDEFYTDLARWWTSLSPQDKESIYHNANRFYPVFNAYLIEKESKKRIEPEQSKGREWEKRWTRRSGLNKKAIFHIADKVEITESGNYVNLKYNTNYNRWETIGSLWVNAGDVGFIAGRKLSQLGFEGPFIVWLSWDSNIYIPEEKLKAVEPEKTEEEKKMTDWERRWVRRSSLEKEAEPLSEADRWYEDLDFELINLLLGIDLFAMTEDEQSDVLAHLDNWWNFDLDDRSREFILNDTDHFRPEFNMYMRRREGLEPEEDKARDWEKRWMRRSSLKKKADTDHQAWIDPEGKEYPVSLTGHVGWLFSHEQMLKDQYGINLSDLLTKSQDVDKGLYEHVLRLGWTRMAREGNFEVWDIANSDTKRIIEDYIKKYPTEHYYIDSFQPKPNSLGFSKEELVQFGLDDIINEGIKFRMYGGVNIRTIKTAQKWESVWFGPDGARYNCKSHSDWVVDKKSQNLLKEKYGLDVEPYVLEEESDFYSSAVNHLVENGFTQVTNFNEGGPRERIIAIDIKDLPLAEEVKSYVEENKPSEVVIATHDPKSVYRVEFNEYLEKFAGLEEYKKKRDFSKTKEPEGEEGKTKTTEPIWVLQRHQAEKAGPHGDFRLEDEGVLKSFVIRKLDPFLKGELDKVMVIQTEDHPIEYAEFEGSIPSGEYGGGDIEIEDGGTFETINESKGKWTFRLKGDKLSGIFSLIAADPNKFGEDKWFLVRSKEK